MIDFKSLITYAQRLGFSSRLKPFARYYALNHTHRRLYEDWYT